MPEFYRLWLGDRPEFSAPVAEPALDCRQCFMQKPKGLTRDLGPFKPSLKCCTYRPFLPSFTIGTLILENRVADDVLVNYLGQSFLTAVGALPGLSVNSATAPFSTTSICETGKNEAKRCSFLSKDENAVCTIRDFRPAACAGYVCRSSQGAEGLKAWRRWEARLGEFEWSLAHLTAFQLGYTLDDVLSPFPNADWACEFYVKASRVARTISVSDVTGPTVER